MRQGCHISRTCSTALSITLRREVVGTSLEQVLTDRPPCRQFTCTMKLPEFTHSHLEAFHVADAYDVERHIFQEFMKRIVIILCGSFFQERRVNKRYYFLYTMALKDWMHFPKLSTASPW